MFSKTLVTLLFYCAISFCLLLPTACRQTTSSWGEDRDRLQTYTPEDWDYWEVAYANQEGNFRTNTPEDWDYWNYTLAGENGPIRTYTPNDWDYWNIDNGRYTLRTYTPGDWDYWELTGNGISITIRTNTPQDWDYWELSGDVTGLLRTYTPNDWDNWEMEGDWTTLDPAVQASLLFLPIFISSIKEQGICC